MKHLLSPTDISTAKRNPSNVENVEKGSARVERWQFTRFSTWKSLRTNARLAEGVLISVAI